MRDRDAEDCARAERSFAAALGGGCTQPVGAFASVRGEELTLTGFCLLDALVGERRGSIVGPRDRAEALGRRLAARLAPNAVLREGTGA